MAQGSERVLTTSLDKLQISPSNPASKKQSKAPVAESWEDEAGDDGDHEEEDDGALTPKRPDTSDLPGAPPPTPSSPYARDTHSQYHSFPPLSFGGIGELGAPASKTNGEERRPDKTTSVASRLIAAGIGQKAPKRTQEQREYDQAMRVQEKKKRDQAKAEEERKKREKEQAQKDIWGD